MGDSGSKKKIAVAGIASILLVAAVVGVVVGTRKSGGSDQPATGTTSRAVQAICTPTDYKETCEKSLANANTTDPKELVKLAFDAAVKNIGDVLKNSALLKEAASDESTKDAFVVCQEVLETAVDDLRRSVDKVGEFNADKANEYVEDVKTWLSAVITNQETCIDAFENTTGDTGEKMKNLMKTAREMASNGLAMVNDASSILGTLQLGNVGSSRRLMSAEGRVLYNGDPTDYAPGEEPHSLNAGVKSATEPEFVKRRLLQATKISLQPTIVVAKDGSGKFKTIGEAIATLPKKTLDPKVIYVKAGLYAETVQIPKNVNNVMLIGDGPMKTRITGKKCFADGVKTFHTATVAVNADDFLAKDIAFENSAGARGHQAVALRVSGDRAVFFNVIIDGYQDTLYAHTYRQYYSNCTISGTIDFIFGDSRALFQDCTFVVRKPDANQACMVTAQGRVEPRSQSAIVIQNGDITAEKELLDAKPPVKVYLGRPWKQYSRTIIMQSNIGGFVDPAGWSPWMGTFALDTCYYGEYENRGPGSNMANRVTWKGIKKITPQIAQSFTGAVIYDGDQWIKASGVPYVPTLMKV